MVAIETDVLSVYHIFQRDYRFDVIGFFMEESREVERGAESLTLLELCGVIAAAD